MRTRLAVRGVLVVVMIASGCASSDSAPAAEPSSFDDAGTEPTVPSVATSTPEVTTPTPEVTTSTAEVTTSTLADPAFDAAAYDRCAAWPGLAVYAVERGLLDAQGLAEQAVPVGWDDRGFWTFEERGTDGLEALLQELVAAETVCDGPVSVEAVGAIEDFLAAGGGVEHRGILLDAIGTAQPVGLRAHPATSDGPASPRQRARDALGMAAHAAMQGDDQGAQRLIDLAMSIYGAEARKRIESGADAQDLIGIAASGQLMGDDDLAGTASAALHELIKQQVAAAAADFDPCAVAGSARNSALVAALARAELAGVPDVAPADATPERRAYDHDTYKRLLDEWVERNEAVANGEEDNVCPGVLFRVETPWSAGLSSGTLDVWLVSCDLQTWTGTLMSSGEMVLPDGSMTFERAYELRFEFGPNGFWDGAVAEAELDGRLQWRLEGPKFAGSWTTQVATGTAKFQRVESLGEFRAQFDDVTLQGEITAGGHSVPVAFPTGFPPVRQLSVLEPGGDMCRDDA